ncbi:MAG TPA: Xaa-Pro peptidase family protein [Steroidobacteraceae bacterium]
MTAAARSPKSEAAWRTARIRKAIGSAGFDALIAFAPAWRRENVRYVTDAALDSSAALAYVPLSGAVSAFACSPLDAQAMRQTGFVDDVQEVVFPDVSGLADRVREDFARGRVGIAGAEFVPVTVWRQLQSLLPQIEFATATDLMDGIRLVKSEFELARLRRAGEICDLSWKAFQAACRPGVREFEIVADVEARLRAEGAEDNFMLIASGGDEVRGMTPPSDRRLERGDLVRTELTPQFKGYWTQICRTAVVGPSTDRHRESFALFEEAVVAGLEAIKPGVTAHEVAKAENDVFRRHGYGEYCTSDYTRVRGHCMGLYLDEVHIIEGVHTVLEENAVLVVHPNTFTPLAGYFVLGDTVIVTPKGPEPLLSTPRELNAVLE